MGCCDDNGPTAFVQLHFNGKPCQKYGIAGMVALIEAGDRAEDAEIVRRRGVCRGCPERAGTPSLPLCGLTLRALHWDTAVGSHDCEKWQTPAHPFG